MVAVAVVTTSCATPTIITAQARNPGRVALVSVAGSRDLGVSIPSQTGFGYNDGLGEDATELLVGDTMTFLEDVYGADRVVGPKVSMASKKYNNLPEAQPSDLWSQADSMIAVDFDHPNTAQAMAALARSLDVDAVVAVRHEWWLSRDRGELIRFVSLYDRCTVLLVNRDEQVLWRQQEVTQSPLRALWSSQLDMGLGGLNSIDELRAAARELGRNAYAQLKSAVLALPPIDAPPSTRVTEPPPPLSAAPPPLSSPAEAQPSPTPADAPPSPP